jgi:hypothetical protein
MPLQYIPIGCDALVQCPALCGVSEGDVWGFKTYIDISHVCKAAIHNGAITSDAGGTVALKFVSGMFWNFL